MNEQEACPRIESLSALVDDELEAAQRAALQAHVAGCAICAPVLGGMRRLHAGFAALPTPARDFDVAAEVDRRIAALAGKPAGTSPAARPRWWQVVTLAPGGALAVGAGLWLGAAMVPAAASPAAAQMAAFSAAPPGAVCIVPGSCGTTRP